jgi:tRNA A37 methylthiotransferase MiaB
VVDEIEWLQKNYDFDLIWFVDDVFTVSHKWLHEFRDELQKRQINISFECITRADRLNEEVLSVLKECGCFRVWIGAESGSQRIIDAMDRRVDVGQVRAMIQAARQTGIEAGTFIMLGYPGETEADHEEMLRWVEETRFERLGVFTYSHEENTHAHLLQDDVPQDVKQARAEAVMELQQGISASLNQEKTGRTFQVLIDRKEGDYFIGRTEFDSAEVDNEVLVDAATNFVRVGDFANIEITSAEDYDLFGVLAD